VLFYIHLRDRDKVLKIGGPAEDIERIVAQAKAYLGWEKPDVEIMALTPDAEFAVGEFTVNTARTSHAVAGLAYRFRDGRTGQQIGISGDTGYLPALAEHFREVDLLVYEAARGLAGSPDEPSTGHSGVRQSATIARDARAGQLYIVHTLPGDKTEIIAAAREIFPQTYWAEPGERVVI
jgi:ribonuclease BN (tRNA processing enzyme)